MNNHLDHLYHLTSVGNCGEILRSGKLHPRIQEYPNCTVAAKCALNPWRFVHFNFCPRSLMLWNVYQGRCWSADKIWGQEDAVHIEIIKSCLMVNLSLVGDENENVIISDHDFLDKRRKAWVLDVLSWENYIGGFIDFSEINISVNTIDAEEHPKKGAEIMIGREILLCTGMVSAIVVRDAKAKTRLLQKDGMPSVYAKKVFIRPEWYF